LPLTARIRDERWNDIEVPGRASFSRLSNRAIRLGKPLLSALNPYGVTVFNALQLPGLLSELDEIVAQEPQNIEDASAELRRLAARVIESKSLLLVFLGD
jgi:hypothetical protein